jgi:hypothetical protein
LRAKLAGRGGGTGGGGENNGQGDNKDTAAALRAKLDGGSAAGQGHGDGNKSTAAALRAKLSGRAGVAAVAAGSGGAGGGGEREVVHLPLVDAAGRAMPGTFGREGAGEAARRVETAVGGRAPKRVQRYGEDGEKTRYFADDDAVDLQVGVRNVSLAFALFLFFHPAARAGGDQGRCKRSLCEGEEEQATRDFRIAGGGQAGVA